MQEGPDLGWAWVVACACCYVNFVMFGTARLSGVFFVYFIDNFQATREQSSLPFAISAAIRNLIGPLVGLLGHHWGVRWVTILGGIVCTTGVSLCYLATDMIWIVIFWGAVNGIGFGLSSILIQMSINDYFLKYRATASGISLSGNGLGSFILPLLLDHFVDSYGLAGSFLLMGGINLNVVVAAALIRPPSWLKYKTSDHGSQLAEEGENKLKVTEVVSSSVFTVTPSVFGFNHCQMRRHTIGEYNGTFRQESGKPRSDSCSLPRKNNWSDFASPDVLVHCKDINPLPLVNEPNVSMSVRKGWHLRQKFSVMLDPTFNLLSLTLAMFVFIFTPYMVILDFVIDKGFTQKTAKYMIPAFSVGDLIGRLGLGWITDRGFMKRSHFITLNLILVSGVLCLYPSLHHIASLLALSVLYGMASGSVMVLIPVLVAESFERDEQTFAMGAVNFASGILNFSVPPLVGYFRDHLRSYNEMFYLLGGLIFVNGLLWLLEPALARRKAKRNQSPIG